MQGLAPWGSPRQVGVPRAWDLWRGRWIRACALARECRPDARETPVSVLWWLLERTYEHGDVSV
jgi:hypothetical protein